MEAEKWQIKVDKEFKDGERQETNSCTMKGRQ